MISYPVSDVPDVTIEQNTLYEVQNVIAVNVSFVHEILIDIITHGLLVLCVSTFSQDSCISISKLNRAQAWKAIIQMDIWIVFQPEFLITTAWQWI